MKKIKHKVERIFQKIYIKEYKKTYADLYTLKSENEPLVIKICRKAVKYEGAKLLVCPVSGKRYIKNEVLDNYIIISESNIDIINHNYSYSIPICKKTYKTILLIFDGHVARMRDVMEKEIRSNIKYSLESIYKRI